MHIAYKAFWAWISWLSKIYFLTITNHVMIKGLIMVMCCNDINSQVSSHCAVWSLLWHHNGRMASQITSLMIVYSIIHLGAGQRKHQSSASLDFVQRIHQRPVNYQHKTPVIQKMFPFDDVIIIPRQQAKGLHHGEKAHKSLTFEELGTRTSPFIFHVGVVLRLYHHFLFWFGPVSIYRQ